MKKIAYIFGLLICAPTWADLQCQSAAPSLTPIQTACLDTPATSQNIEVQASHSQRVSDTVFNLRGNVCVKRDQMRMMTPQLSFDQLSNRVKSQGGVWFQGPDQRLAALDAEIDNQNKTAVIHQLDYFLIDSDINGQAASMTLQDNTATVQDLTFSSCAPEQRSWEISAREAVLDHESGMGTFRGAKLKVNDTTIFYLPWIKLPLNDDRRSGLLVPSFSYSENTGLDLTLPYYFNLHPQYDLTLTPRYLQDHGLMLGADFRYLTQRSRGELESTYLPSDDKRNKDRGILQYRHSTRFSPNWRFNANLNHVSDAQYYEDFASSSFLTSTPYLKSQVSVSGHGSSWSFFAGFDDFQVLSQNITSSNEPYQKLPEIRYHWFKPAGTDPFDYGVDTEWVSFYREQSVGAWRADIKPWVATEWGNAWGRVRPKVQYRSTHYDFDDGRSNISRSLPIVSVDSGLTFEKWFDSGAHKTIEPRLFYVYVPEEDQSDIPIFDTRELTFGSAMLFQTNRFSGADRQSDMNQAALAITHRSFDVNGQERWNLTLGQINYFDDQRVQINGAPENLTKSPLIAEYNLYLHRNWSAGVSLHYDQDDHAMERGLFKVQRKTDQGDVFNFAYRFRRNKIEQLDASWVIPIRDKHRLLARWNYSIENNKTIEALFGYEHKSCCWALRLMARRYLVDETGMSNDGFYVEFQLNGLGALGRNPRRILKQTILGYEEAF